MFTKEEEEKFYQQVGELIKSSRIRADKTHENVGGYVGLSRASIINIENGRQKILIHTLTDVAEFLKVDIKDLIPSKQNVVTTINEEIKTKINKKVGSEIEANKMEGFINLSSSKQQNNDSK